MGHVRPGKPKKSSEGNSGRIIGAKRVKAAAGLGHLVLARQRAAFPRPCVTVPYPAHTAHHPHRAFPNFRRISIGGEDIDAVEPAPDTVAKPTDGEDIDGDDLAAQLSPPRGLMKP